MVRIYTLTCMAAGLVPFLNDYLVASQVEDLVDFLAIYVEQLAAAVSSFERQPLLTSELLLDVHVNGGSPLSPHKSAVVLEN